MTENLENLHGTASGPITQWIKQWIKLENLHGTASGPMTQWIKHPIIGIEADGSNLDTVYLLIS